MSSVARLLENTAFSYVVSAAFIWGAVVVVALAISRSPVRPPASIALLMSFLFKGIAVTLSIPSVSVLLDRAIGVHNICRLILSLTGGMAWTACVLAVITFWESPAGVPIADCACGSSLPAWSPSP